MDVATILKRKGSAVLTVTPETSIAAVVKILREKRIGVVVVSETPARLEAAVWAAVTRGSRANRRVR